MLNQKIQRLLLAAFSLILFFSTNSFASDSECYLRVVVGKEKNSVVPYNPKSPFHVYIGNNFQSAKESALDALKHIDFLQENHYCRQNISSEIPYCKIDYLPADQVVLSFYTVFAGDDFLVDTIKLDIEENQKDLKEKQKDIKEDQKLSEADIKKAKMKAQEKAENLVNALKVVRFCK